MNGLAASHTAEVGAMNFRMEMICVKEDGTEERREVLAVGKINWPWKRWA